MPGFFTGLIKIKIYYTLSKLLKNLIPRKIAQEKFIDLLRNTLAK